MGIFNEEIDGPTGLFVHIPKTGGTSVEHALQKNWPDLRPPRLNRKADARHYLSEHVDEPFDFAFAVVRHPVSWYESWFRFLNSPQVLDRNLIVNGQPDWDLWIGEGVWHPLRDLVGTHAPTFQEYIERVIELRPGFITGMYQRYLSDPRIMVARTEHLAEDVDKIMRLQNLQLSVLPGWTNRSASLDVTWQPSAKERILQLEHDVIAAFFTVDIDPLNEVAL